MEKECKVGDLREMREMCESRDTDWRGRRMREGERWRKK